MRTLLGTRIHELELEPGSDVTLVSDLHLDPAWPDKTDAFAELVDSVPDGGQLLVPGDLFEFWLGRSQLRVEAWRAVPEILAAAVARDVRVQVMHGNRDFQLDRRFARETGVGIVDGGLLVRARGEPVLLILHGDELCTNDEAYQKSKRWLRSRSLRALMHRLPYSWAQRAVARGRKVSKESVGSRDPETLRPSRAALAEVARFANVDLLFGHVHQAASGELLSSMAAADSPRYFVLPEFCLPDRGHARWRVGEAPRLVLGDREVPWPPGLMLGD